MSDKARITFGKATNTPTETFLIGNREFRKLFLSRAEALRYPLGGSEGEKLEALARLLSERALSEEGRKTPKPVTAEWLSSELGQYDVDLVFYMLNYDLSASQLEQLRENLRNALVKSTAGLSLALSPDPL